MVTEAAAELQQSSPSSMRVDSVDLLRGLAMMGLVLVHSVLYLTPPPDGVDLVYAIFALALGDLGAALFTTLVGISFVLSMRRRADAPEREVLLSAAVRGLFLVVVTMSVSVLCTGVETIFDFDVLVLIGIASAVLPLVRKWSSSMILVGAALIVAAAPLVRGWFNFVGPWGGGLKVAVGISPTGLLMRPTGEYLPGLDPMSAITGLIAGGWFPLLPWMAFPLAGMVLGRQIMADREGTSRRWVLLGFAGLAVGLGLALTALHLRHANPVTDYVSVFSLTPNSMSMVVFQVGVVLLLLGVTRWAVDGRTQGRWMYPLRLLSRYALTVYVASYLMIFGIIRVADLIDPSRKHEFSIVTSGWALLIGIGLVAVGVILLRVWDRRGGVGSLEWVMAQLRVGATRRRSADQPGDGEKS